MKTDEEIAASMATQLDLNKNKVVDDFVKLSFKTITNRSFSITLPKHATILQLKQLIEQDQGVPINQQRIIRRDPNLINDKELKLDGETISTLGLNSQSILLLCKKWAINCNYSMTLS